MVRSVSQIPQSGRDRGRMYALGHPQGLTSTTALGLVCARSSNRLDTGKTDRRQCRSIYFDSAVASDRADGASDPGSVSDKSVPPEHSKVSIVTTCCSFAALSNFAVRSEAQVSSVTLTCDCSLLSRLSVRQRGAVGPRYRLSSHGLIIRYSTSHLRVGDVHSNG